MSEATLVSVFGPKFTRVLVELNREQAVELFGELDAEAWPTGVIDATRMELELLDQRRPGLAMTARAAVAVSLAYEMENPYNSATSKANCARELRELMRELVLSLPLEEQADAMDELAARRQARLAN